MKSIKILTGLTILTLLILTGCLKDLSEEKRKEEEAQIQSYLQQNGISSNTLTDDGIYFILQKENNPAGAIPEYGDLIVINYTVRKLQEGIVFNTNDSLVAAEYLQNPDEAFVYGPHKVYLAFQIAGMNYGFLNMKEGDSATIIIPSYLAYNDYTTLIADLELLDVIVDPAGEISDFFKNEILPALDYDFTDTISSLPDTVLNVAYISFDNISYAESDLDTLTYDEILISYSAYYIEDIEGIETNRRFESVSSYDAVDDEVNRLPAALKGILHSIPVSTSATIYLPYTIAFKNNGLRHPNGYYIVPPYTSIYYKVFIQNKVRYKIVEG